MSRNLPTSSILPSTEDEIRDGFFSRSSIGSVKTDDEFDFVEFYAINECRLERCPIFVHCKHLKKERQCQIQVKYLKGINQIIFSQVKIEDLTPVQKMKIGLHLKPLYRTLCRLKMEELSLRRPTQLTNTGTRAMHPIYREIRETIKVITMALRDLNLDGDKAKEEEESYYDSLFADDEKPGLVRRRKK